MEKRLKRAAGWAVCIVFTVAACVSIVGAVNPNQKCTLLMDAANQYDELREDTHIAANLYRVADVNEAYLYQPNDTYASLSSYTYTDASGHTETLNIRNLKDASSDQWDALSAAAFDIATTTVPDATVSFVNGTATISRTADGTDLTAGLYLLYAYRTTDQLNGYTYTYSPVLVSLPSMNAQDGSDIYDVSLQLKPEKDLCYGNLEIVKTLSRYSTLQGTATFVFQIDAAWEELQPDGSTKTKTYSDVISMNFDQPETQSYVLEGKIPVGTAVTVTEVYSGASYTVVGESAKTVTIAPDDKQTAQAVFTNTYDRSQNAGSSVENQFSKDENGNWTGRGVYSNGETKDLTQS